MKGRGVGLVVLVVVLVVVLLLVARAWRKVAPTAVDVSAPSLESPLGASSSAPAAAPGGLPNLQQMRQNTSAHADAVDEALREVR